MWVVFAVLALWCLVSPVAVSAADKQPPKELYDALNALRIDPAAVYSLEASNRIELRRGDAKLSFDEGKLAFFAPFDGRITGAVFAGRGHALAMPRDPVEKQQMARFLGAPVLDQDFTSAYLRFTDDSAEDLLRQFKNANVAPQQDTAYAAQWEPHLARVNPQYSFRILFETLSQHPRHFFYAGLEGIVTGGFDVLLDNMRAEQMLSNESFTGRAPAHVVDAEREKLERYRRELDAISN